MKKREEKMSEILAQAVKLLNDAEKACAANYEMMKEQDAKTQDLLHKLELENLTRDQRATLSTQLRDCRRLRRCYKDAWEELQPIVEFTEEPGSKEILQKMTQIVSELRKVDKYHQNRFYVPKAR